LVWFKIFTLIPGGPIPGNRIFLALR